MAVTTGRMVLQFNTDISLTEFGELVLDGEEEILFQSECQSDAEDFGLQGTLYLTNHRIAWVSDQQHTYEIPCDDLGAYGVSGSEMFVQFCCDPPQTFVWIFPDEEIAQQLQNNFRALEENNENNMDTNDGGAGPQIQFTAYDNNGNDLFNEIQTGSEMQEIHDGSELGGLDLATNMNEFDQGGWVTAENAHLFELNDFSQFNTHVEINTENLQTTDGVNNMDDEDAEMED